MTTINFPSDPEVNDEYTFGTRTWRWTGEAWQLVATALVGPTGPTGPTPPNVARTTDVFFLMGA